MKRVALVVAGLVVGLAACVPQVVGVNPLTIGVAGPQTAVVTFEPPAGTFDVVLFIGDAQRLVSVPEELSCSAFETGWQCLADSLGTTVSVTAFGDPLELVSAQVWWSVPGQLVNLARVDLQ